MKKTYVTLNVYSDADVEVIDHESFVTVRFETFDVDFMGEQPSKAILKLRDELVRLFPLESDVDTAAALTELDQQDQVIAYARSEHDAVLGSIRGSYIEGDGGEHSEVMRAIRGQD